ncbi:MAG: hypothetical protein LBP35_05075 [Candidatus Ancillula trichonymphae]|nr:hypothetical protein [Candidatus Ancillula trichonymphae]
MEVGYFPLPCLLWARGGGSDDVGEGVTSLVFVLVWSGVEAEKVSRRGC